LLRPFELPRLLSRGALVEESLSTRLDSVRAPDRLCVLVEDLLDDERLLEDRPFDFDDEPLELPLLLLRDREERWGILPTPPVVNP
jgi:hypothetical protein